MQGFASQLFLLSAEALQTQQGSVTFQQMKPTGEVDDTQTMEAMVQCITK